MNSIAFLCHPYHRGGVTRWMVDAAEEFARQEYDVYFTTVKPVNKFISGKNSTLMINMFGEKHPNLKIIFQDVNFAFELGTMEYRVSVYIKIILKYIPAGTPIIVSDDEVIWKSAAAIAHRNPVIGVLHSDDSHYFKLAIKYVNHISAFVAVSKRIAQKCKTYELLKTTDVTVIPCGIVLPGINPVFQNNNKSLSLVWTGRLEEKQKRISDLPKIALKLKEAGIKFHLDIIGHGPERPRLEDQIKLNNLSTEISMHGWLDNDRIKKILANTDLLLLPSNYEGMSVAIMEALAAGCGIISSRVSGVEDLESLPLAKNCIWLYPTGDIESALHCINAAQQIPVNTRKISARELAEKEFSISACMDKYTQICFSAIPRQRKMNFNFSGIKQLQSYLISLFRFLKFKVTR